MATSKEGTTLGSYRIISQAGKGGMATVYKAHQTSMERVVALKVLPEQHSQDPEFTQRFIREARTIAQLEHRNILPVYDFGKSDGVTYMAMRYLDSGTLQDILRLGQLSLYEALDIMRQICAGLDYAHRKGIVHRDIKPANVMIDDEGTVYLTDFGLAKAFRSSSNLTATGVIMGTPSYMAPEQSIGDEIDGRTDIYAAGIILYEMLTGKVPFESKTPLSVIMAHIHEPLPYPKMINPDLPDEIQDIIIKALEKKSEDRFQTAKEMSDALTEVMQNLQVKAETKTLTDLTTEAREQADAKTIMPTENGFTPLSVRLTTAEPARLSRNGTLFRVVGGIAFLALTIFFAVSFFGSKNDILPVVDKKPGEPLLYDDFNDSKYDDTVNTNIWFAEMESACLMAQNQGELVIKNEIIDSDMDECDLTIQQPEDLKIAALEDIEAKTFISSDFSGDFGGQGLMFSTEYPNGDSWYSICGAETAGNGSVAQLWVAHISPDGTTQEDYLASSEIQPDTWYTYTLKIDAKKGEITCLVDGKIIGSTILGNFSEMSDLNFERGITAWRAPNTTLTTKVDDFTLIP